MSITLHGCSISNYYNKVKLALLEKGVAFAEARAGTPGGKTADAGVLDASPLGKIPYLTTEQGPICESQPILDYVEARWPEPRLLPADPFAAAKVRELTTFTDWHLEIVARRLYGSAYFNALACPTRSATRSGSSCRRTSRPSSGSRDSRRTLPATRSPRRIAPHSPACRCKTAQAAMSK